MQRATPPSTRRLWVWITQATSGRAAWTALWIT